MQRVVSSIFDSEALALLAALEQAVVLKAQLIEIMNIPEKLIKIEAFCDNNDVEQAVHSSKQTQKGRIRVDIGNIKDMLEQNMVNSLTWIRTQL